MNAIQIEYLLGLFFFVTSLSYTNSRVTADVIRLVAGILLLVMAFMGFSPIK